MRGPAAAVIAALLIAVACSSEDGTATSTPAGAASPTATTTATAAATATATATPTPSPTPTPVPDPVIGETTEVDGNRYTVNEVRDPAPPGIFGVADGRRLVEIDVTQHPAEDGGLYNALNFTLQDTEARVYQIAFEGSALIPAFGTGSLTADHPVRGWITYSLPEEVTVAAVLVQSNLLAPRSVIADVEASPSLVSDAAVDLGTAGPPLGTAVETLGRRYTVHEVRDPAPPGIFGVPLGQRLIGIDLTLEAVDATVTANSFNISIQDTSGFVYIRGIEVSALSPGFPVATLTPGQQQRGWVVIPVPEDATLFSVLAQADLLSEAVPIASLVN